MDKIAQAFARFHGEAEEGPDALAPFRSAASRDARHLPGEISYTRTRVVATAPQALRENRVVGGLEPGPIADAYKILSIQVMQRLREKGWNALAVLSPGEGEGKTL